jgi:hypothetical protein
MSDLRMSGRHRAAALRAGGAEPELGMDSEPVKWWRGGLGRPSDRRLRVAGALGPGLGLLHEHRELAVQEVEEEDAVLPALADEELADLLVERLVALFLRLP